MKRCATFLIAPLLLSACGLVPSAPARAIYDLGPPPAPTLPLSANTWRVAEVAAPPWLSGNGIAYRLAFQQPHRLEHYRDSAWAAPPAALVTQRLRERIGMLAACPANPVSQVAVHLDEFEQVFSSATTSQVVLRVQATIRRGGLSDTGPKQQWRLERPAAPDAPGAVRALAQAVDDWLPQLGAWLAASCR